MRSVNFIGRVREKGDTSEYEAELSQWLVWTKGNPDEETRIKQPQIDQWKTKADSQSKPLDRWVPQKINGDENTRIKQYKSDRKTATGDSEVEIPGQ